MNTRSHIPVAAVLLHALAVHGVSGFLDEDDFVVAHPRHIPQDCALRGEHIVLTTEVGVAISVDQYAAPCYAVAYMGSKDYDDYTSIGTVYEASPGGGLITDAHTCAEKAAAWFASRQQHLKS
ncbi:MAG TPA: hypothetical protein VIU15_27800 [Streptomyces sp.]